MNYSLGVIARSRRAYTLLELLVVVAIVGLLTLAAVPMISTMVEGNNLSRGGQELADQVNLARQTSSARNRAVEVRLVKVPLGSSNTEPAGYNGVQLWMGNDLGVLSPFSRMAIMPQGVVITEVPALSKALPNMLAGTMPDPNKSGTVDYVSFQVRPSGMVYLPQATANQNQTNIMKELFLTVVSAKAVNNVDPDNFVTVQVNPLTATPLIYRP